MKITDVTLTLFGWDDIPATTYGRHTGKFGGKSQLGLLAVKTDEGVVGHAFLGSAQRGAHLDGQSLITPDSDTEDVERAYFTDTSGLDHPLGKLNLDAYDAHYTHLFAWDRERGALAGAYRLVATESFAPSQLPHALYTHALFDYGPEFLARLGPALELGRAFVAPEYQRCSRVLAMLWKGIGRALEVANVRALFGAVSVSARYSRRSRGMIAAALATHHRYEHAQLVRARVPFALEVADFAAAADLADPRALSARVAELEPDGAGLPVLAKRYLELGGEFAAWHVDRAFGDSLDGLLVLDLARADRARVARYSASFASAPRTSSVVS